VPNLTTASIAEADADEASADVVAASEGTGTLAGASEERTVAPVHSAASSVWIGRAAVAALE